MFAVKDDLKLSKKGNAKKQTGSNKQVGPSKQTGTVEQDSAATEDSKAPVKHPVADRKASPIRLDAAKGTSPEKAWDEYFAAHPECQWLCGDTIMFGPGHKSELIQARVPASAAHCLSWAYKAPQPGMFWKRSLMENGFDESWRYDFDHDLYVRLLLKGYRCEHLSLPVAAYRWHAISKTMSDRNLFDEEFDRSAEHYEGSLQGSDRRWVRSTRLLRQSYLASGEGRISEARKLLTQAALTYPEGLASKLFWGCVRQLSRRKPIGHTDTREGNGLE